MDAVCGIIYTVIEPRSSSHWTQHPIVLAIVQTEQKDAPFPKGLCSRSVLLSGVCLCWQNNACKPCRRIFGLSKLASTEKLKNKQFGTILIAQF